MCNNKGFTGTIAEPSQLPILQTSKPSMREVSSLSQVTEPGRGGRECEPISERRPLGSPGRRIGCQQLIQEQVPVGE